MTTSPARRGQASTESLLLISVLAVGLALAAYAFIPGFQQGIQALGDDSTALIGAGAANGSGNTR
jgi:hypothetical protein